MFKIISRTALVSFVIIGAASLAAGANAQDERVEQNQTVSTKDVDFNKPADVRTLYTRLQYAAAAVCTSDGPRDPLTMDADEACKTQSVSNAVSSINQPQLTAYDDASAKREPHQYAMNNTH